MMQHQGVAGLELLLELRLEAVNSVAAGDDSSRALLDGDLLVVRHRGGLRLLAGGSGRLARLLLLPVQAALLLVPLVFALEAEARSLHAAIAGVRHAVALLRLWRSWASRGP